jgi:hypothetical protein
MSAATASNLNPSVEDAEDVDNQSTPNVSKEGLGKAMQNGQMMTPEPTPEPEDARNEADRGRRQEQGEEEEEQSTNSESDAAANSAAGGGGDVIQDILQCGEGEHLKVLGITKSYSDPYEQEQAIEWSTWQRGTDTHPKYNHKKDAQKAFDSTYASFSFYYIVLTFNSRSYKGSSGAKLS